MQIYEAYGHIIQINLKKRKNEKKYSLRFNDLHILWFCRLLTVDTPIMVMATDMVTHLDQLKSLR